MDLQVHHVNYDHVGNEDVYNDLITLCKYCHEAVEKQKTEYKEGRAERYSHWQELHKIRMNLTRQFCKEYRDKDITQGGRLNMMNRDVIKSEWCKWLKEKGTQDTDPLTETVIHYFRKIRIEIILEMTEGGATMDMILARGISYNMVRKYYGKTETMQKILECYRKEGY